MTDKIWKPSSLRELTQKNLNQGAYREYFFIKYQFSFKTLIYKHIPIGIQMAMAVHITYTCHVLFENIALFLYIGLWGKRNKSEINLFWKNKLILFSWTYSCQQGGQYCSHAYIFFNKISAMHIFIYVDFGNRQESSRKLKNLFHVSTVLKQVF